MRRIEELLREAPLRPLPPALDRRVRAALDGAASEQPSVALLPIPLWTCAAACLLCALLGFGGGSPPSNGEASERIPRSGVLRRTVAGDRPALARAAPR